MADAAIRIVKFLAEFTFALFNMTTGAISLKNRLPVRQCSRDIFSAVNAGHAVGQGRDDGDFDRECLGILVRADGYGFGKRAALGGDVDLDSNLAVGAGDDDPRQRRQLRRGAAARWPDAQDGDISG